MIKNYIFLGAPGVGKGTMAKKIQEKYGIKHISTGDIFRENIKNKTKLGKKVKAILDSGEYVSDELTNAIVWDAITTEEVKTSGFILDGYPRTIGQAEFLKECGIHLTGSVLLKARDEVVIKRLIDRARGEDDTPEVIKHRLGIYNEKTRPLIDFYKNENQLIEVPSEGTVEENMEAMEAVLF